MDMRETGFGTGFEEITFDLIAAQLRLLKAEYDYEQYARDAIRVGRPDIADFFRCAMAEDSARASQCYQFLTNLGIGAPAGPTGVRGVPAPHHTPASSRRQQ